jgi:SAM-dependent methyltransferase
MAFEELKQRQSTMWGDGTYQNVTETLGDLQAVVIERLAPGPGKRWLDLACGTGAVAELAARAGAEVTGVDLAPALIETAKSRAREQGLEIDYRVGDCERLEGIDDATFDVVSSTVGIMFAPDHEATAAQLSRVLKPGGRLGLVNWEPDGGVGKMFRMMAPFQPGPPPSNPFDWGREERVRELLGKDFELEFEHLVSRMSLPDGESYWQLFSSSYGPTKSLAESLEDERRNDLHRTMVDFFENEYRANGGVTHIREYLLVLGTRTDG